FVDLVNRPAESNSILVDLLEQLGAVLYCKTNVPQTIMAAETNNNVFGRTLNPCNRMLTSGGSSGGEAALMAMGGSIVGFGTDYGGSVRVPAACCGLYGLRTTSRRLPYAAVANVLKGSEANESTIGVFARCVQSIDYVLGAVLDTKPWLHDPRVIPIPRRLRICMLRGGNSVSNHAPIERAMLDARAALRSTGHLVEERNAFNWAGGAKLFREILTADGGHDMRSFVASSREPFVPEAFTLAGSADQPCSEYFKIVRERDEYRRKFHKEWIADVDGKGARFDLYICPVSPSVALPHLGRGYPEGFIAYTTAWSILDFPAISVPITRKIDLSNTGSPHCKAAALLTTDLAYDAVLQRSAPAALQLINPKRFDEDGLIDMVKTVEAAFQRSLNSCWKQHEPAEGPINERP
ncbi:hypothetical protein EMMF5_006572, partial [Cystobasidiomycetes sp. EMM_F5]